MTERFAVRLTAPAEQDIAAIYEYIYAHGSPDSAAALLGKLPDRIDSLAQFARRGATLLELDSDWDEVRQFVIGVYRGIYLIEGDVVLIVAVIDGRRDFHSLLQDRLTRTA